MNKARKVKDNIVIFMSSFSRPPQSCRVCVFPCCRVKWGSRTTDLICSKFENMFCLDRGFKKMRRTMHPIKNFNRLKSKWNSHRLWEMCFRWYLSQLQTTQQWTTRDFLCNTLYLRIMQRYCIESDYLGGFVLSDAVLRTDQRSSWVPGAMFGKLAWW